MAKKNSSDSSARLSRAERNASLHELQMQEVAERFSREHAAAAEASLASLSTSSSVSRDKAQVGRGESDASSYAEGTTSRSAGQTSQGTTTRGDVFDAAGQLLKAGAASALDQVAKAVSPREPVYDEGQVNVSVEQIAAGSLSRAELEAIQLSGSAEQVAYATSALESQSAGERAASGSNETSVADVLGHTRAISREVAFMQENTFSQSQAEAWARGEGAIPAQQEAAALVLARQESLSQSQSAGQSQSHHSNSVSSQGSSFGSSGSFGVSASGFGASIGASAGGDVSQSSSSDDSRVSSSSGSYVSLDSSASLPQVLSEVRVLLDSREVTLERMLASTDASSELQSSGFSRDDLQAWAAGEGVTLSAAQAAQLALASAREDFGGSASSMNAESSTSGSPASDSVGSSASSASIGASGGAGFSVSEHSSGQHGWAWGNHSNTAALVEMTVRDAQDIQNAVRALSAQGLSREQLQTLAQQGDLPQAERLAAAALDSAMAERGKTAPGSNLVTSDGTAVRAGDGSAVTAGEGQSSGEHLAGQVATLQAAYMQEASAYAQAELLQRAGGEDSADVLKQMAQDTQSPASAEAKALFAMSAAALERGDSEGARAVSGEIQRLAAEAQASLGDAMVSSAEARAALPQELQAVFERSPAHILANDGDSGHYRPDATAQKALELQQLSAATRSDELLAQDATATAAWLLGEGGLQSKTPEELEQASAHLQLLGAQANDVSVAQTLDAMGASVQARDSQSLRETAGELASMQLVLSETARKVVNEYRDTVNSLSEPEAQKLEETNRQVRQLDAQLLLAYSSADSAQQYAAVATLTSALTEAKHPVDKLEALDALRQAPDNLMRPSLVGEPSQEQVALAQALATDLPKTDALRDALDTSSALSQVDANVLGETLSPAEREGLAQELVRSANELQAELPSEVVQDAVGKLYALAETVAQGSQGRFPQAQAEAKDALSGLADDVAKEAFVSLVPRLAQLEAHRDQLNARHTLDQNGESFSVSRTDAPDFGTLEATERGVSVTSHQRRDMEDTLPGDQAVERGRDQSEDATRERVREQTEAEQVAEVELELDAD